MVEMRKDPRVGGGVGGTCEVAKNQTQHSPSINIYGCVYTKDDVDLREMIDDKQIRKPLKPVNTLKPFNTIKPSTISSQNEENDQGTMVNTQTLVIQIPVIETPVTQTQKHKPRGVTSMKSVIRARSNNTKLTVEWNAKGQPCNNKGENKLVSYIEVMVRQDISIKFKHWSDERLNAVKDIIWNDIINVFPCNLFRQLLMYFSVYATFDVDEQHKDYIMKSEGKALREFRTNCGNCLRDAEGNVNLKPPAKYANLIDEADWIEFVTYRVTTRFS
ncbi:hypothetical protein Lal_00008530 [Lupinus albus]|nr:hypothetical protein Lal_00008530 [Lupinus albus]